MPTLSRASLGLRRTFLNYALSSAITFPLGLLTTFLVTPELVRVMGLAEFGRFATYGVVFAVLSLTELGLPTAATRDTAKLLGQGRVDSVYRLGRGYVLRGLRTGVLVSLGCYASLGLLLLVGARTDVQISTDTAIDLLLVLAAPALGMPGGVLAGVIAGLQKQHVTRYLMAALSLVNIPATLIVIQRFEPVRALLALGLAFSAVSTLLLLVALRLLLAEDWRARELPPFAPVSVREGLSMSAPSLASFLDTQLDKALLAITSQQALVGAFQLTANISGQVRSYALYPMSPLMPALSAMKGAGRDEDADLLQDRFLSLSLTFGSVAVGLLVGRPDAFASLWLGDAPDAVALVTTALPLAMLGVWLNMQTSGPYLVALTSRHVSRLARIAFGTAAVNAVASAALVLPYGLKGVLAGTCLANAYNLACYRPWRSRQLWMQVLVLAWTGVAARLFVTYSSPGGLILWYAALVVVALALVVLTQKVLRIWLFTMIVRRTA